MLIEILLLLALGLYLFYRWSTSSFEFFEKRGIPFHKPFPLFGSMKDVVFRKKCVFDQVIDLYNMYDGNVYGIFDQRNPLLMLRDPKLIKQITVKDFDHFVNHRSPFGDDHENLFANSLFLLQDAKWRDMRNTLSPAFTGSKMRHMYELINKVAQESTKSLQEEEQGKGLDVDVKDFTTRFTNDIIASTAFGLDVNSYKNKKNEFYSMGKELTTFTPWKNMKFFLYMNFSRIMKLLKIDIFGKEITDYFMRLVLDAMKYRKEHNITRPDMINMLMEARGMINTENANPNSRNWTDIEIVAQCFLFFFAGFETASVLTSFSLHELAVNPDVQQKLLEEIEAVNEELEGKPISYESLKNIKYLDMVVSETLRKWPGAIAVDRVASKDYEYVADNGERIEIKKGDCVWIPVVGMQRDPKYFPDPMKFDPERFSDENKDKMVPFTYLPFGAGPRNCIGFRFALLETKAMLYYLLRDFKIVPGEKTCIPMELSASSFQILPKTGFWLKFISRKAEA